MPLNEASEHPAVSTVIRNTRLTFEMIKIEHTLFALPFAILGAVLAANGLPTLRQIGWIIVAMVGALVLAVPARIVPIAIAPVVGALLPSVAVTARVSRLLIAAARAW